LKAQVIAASRAGSVDVLTDPAASPTGFPFKVAHIPGTLSDKALYEQRERVCDLGYLRQPYRKQDGSIGYRCSAEPVEDYVRKGGDAADCVGRKCLCNALAAAVGLPQIRKGVRELPLVTAGAGLNRIPEFTGSERDGYSANTVMDRLQGKS
jgi:NAD(P)H-dependent flavin oxidoreductase YrpB (nitropropane dioxygenase family)